MLNMSFIKDSVRKDSEGAGCAPAKILELQPARRPASPAEISVRPAVCDYVGPALRAGLVGSLVDPCLNCDLREWCEEPCAHHLYSLDSESEPEDFEEWLTD